MITMAYAELALLVFATVGLFVTIQNLWHAIAEFQYAHGSNPHSEIRELIAAGIARQEIVFVLLSLGLMVYAVWEVWLPIQDHPPDWAVMSLALTNTVLVAFRSVRELADRRRLEELVNGGSD